VALGRIDDVRELGINLSLSSRKVEEKGLAQVGNPPRQVIMGGVALGVARYLPETDRVGRAAFAY
jgi:hypothetical protein